MRNLFESIIDVGSGLLLAIGIQMLIFPYFNMHPTIFESFHIAVIFTFMSIFRSWFWRTFFNFKRKKIKGYYWNGKTMEKLYEKTN
tara:strand:+ start:840 stop:1097 length:258 start_codon:yes stop_codon:yes gene_type:complete